MAQNMYAGEANMPGMPAHIEEGNGAGPALCGVHPVAGPGILANIGVAAIPDVEAIERVKENREPDAEQFQRDDKRETGEKFDLLGIRRWAVDGEGGGDEVINQDISDCHDDV